MKGKKLENYGNKIGLMGCIWSSLSAPGTGSPLSHPFLGLGDCPFSQLLALRGNKNGLPSMKVKKLSTFWSKMGFIGCNWSGLNDPGTETPLSRPFLEL